jgi:hypothetical protein
MKHDGLPTSTMHRSILRSVRQEEPKSIVRLVEEIERDYQFKLGYLVIQALVQSARASIEVEAPGDESRATRLGDNLQRTWAQSLPQATRAFAYGRAAFERTYRYDRAANLHLVASLDYLPPEHSELVLGEDGAFAGVRLATEEGSVLLGPERSWWFALDPTATAPHGRSRYLGAPQEIWRARRKLEEEERIWFSKFALGHGVARAPDAHAAPARFQDGPGDSGEIVDPMEALRRELAAIESGGVLILSSKTYADGKYHYDYQESQGLRDSTPIEHRRQMLDVAALRSLGIPERAVTQDGQTGSRAVAQVHLEVLYRTAEGIVEQIAASFDRYVVAKAVEVNWPERRRPAHRVRWSPIGAET